MSPRSLHRASLLLLVDLRNDIVLLRLEHGLLGRVFILKLLLLLGELSLSLARVGAGPSRPRMRPRAWSRSQPAPRLQPLHRQPKWPRGCKTPPPPERQENSVRPLIIVPPFQSRLLDSLLNLPRVVQIIEDARIYPGVPTHVIYGTAVLYYIIRTSCTART